MKLTAIIRTAFRNPGKLSVLVIIPALAVLVLWTLWARLAAPTRVAFLNYQVISLGEIAEAGADLPVRLFELTPEDASVAGRYDILLINGM